ncbi:MAG: hypothetical protein KKD36_08815 [Bacteroidetes bacterium]|nr:hypothetical protein [Bacteroidota bacterium]
MKNTSLWLVILPLLIVSCTNDSINDTERIENKVANKKSGKLNRTMQNLSPENSANEYDIAGKLHNDILEIYLTDNYQYTTIAEVNQRIKSIVAANTSLSALNLDANSAVDLEEINEIITNPQSKLQGTIANSSLTTIAKLSLSNFMNTVTTLENEEYESIYQTIVSYESYVITDPQFTSEDKRIILTTSSLVRYSLYFAKERKDKDWDSSVGNRAGAIVGALENSSTAVTRSLVTGILTNNLIAH